MDPLSAIGLAGTIVQFVDFGIKIIVQGRELYESGSLKLNAQVEAVTNDLLDFSTKFKRSSRLQDETRPLTENELALRKLCDECDEVAQQLLERLARLKPKLLPPNEIAASIPNKEKEILFKGLKGRKREVERMSDSLRLGLLSVWNRKEMEEVGKRLEKYRSAIQTRMIASLGDQVQILSVKQSQRFDDLDRETKLIAGALLDDIRVNTAENIRQQTNALAQLISRREIVVIDPGHEDQRRVVTLGTTNDAAVDTGKIVTEGRERSETSKGVLSHLHFQAETERYESVSEAHSKTFGWIYHRENFPQETKWDNFSKWLEHGDGLYWISGKAGSGKSTLMKFMADNCLTRKYLSTWAGSSELYTAHFYFWNLGTTLQKSQIGLLRSLLLAVLKSRQDLIPLVLPEQWAKVYNSRSSILGKQGAVSFSLSFLLKAWNTLVNYVSRPEHEMKLAIFVDGLDEYEGLDADMARLFGAAADASRVKVCVSSRPHVIFEKAFAKRPSLRLQDLTYNDIKTYVEDRLVKDEGMQELFALEPVKTHELVDEIVKSADGVFLWVYLVVSSLLRGLGNCDQISDLQRKLQLLPKDLKQLYTHMIVKVDEDYKEEATQFFQLVNATQPRSTDKRPLKRMTILGLCLAKECEENLPVIMKRYRDSHEAMTEGCIAMSRRLNSRTGGLMEVQLVGRRLADLTPFMKVGYVHRTVRDFLMTREVRNILQANTDFNADYAIFKSSICEWRLVIGDDLEDESWFNGGYNSKILYNSALVYAKRCQAGLPNRNSVPQTQLIDQLRTKNPIKRHFTRLRDDDLITDPIATTERNFHRDAVEWGLVFYINDEMRHAHPWTKRKYLVHALTMNEFSDFPRIILSILKIGCDPFVEDLHSITPKQTVILFTEYLSILKSLISTLLSQKLNHPSYWTEIFQYFLNWKIRHGSGGNGDDWTTDEAFVERFRDAAKMVNIEHLFQEAMEERGGVWGEARGNGWGCCVM